MIDPLSLAVATLSLAVSAVTAWMTLLGRGRVVLSRPMSVYFGPDDFSKKAKPKIYIRALLYCTAKRGRVVESIHASLRTGEMRQNFNIWVYGQHKQYVRGSGLFVGDNGVSFSHHFLTLPEDSDFRFRPGIYNLELFIRLLGESIDRVAFSGEFEITQEVASGMTEKDVGVYFDWGPDSHKYWPHLDERPSIAPDQDDFSRAFDIYSKKMPE